MGYKVELPSGAKLEITLAPFVDARALYQAFADEFKTLKIQGTTELDYNFLKDIFLVGISSKKIEQALDLCMKRATYNGAHIDGDTFTPEESRQDYFEVCFEIAKVNIMPFTKALMQKYSHVLGALKKSVPA